MSYAERKLGNKYEDNTYTNKHLIGNEQIIYQTKLSWAVYLRPIFFFVFGLTLLAGGKQHLPELFLL